MSSRQKVAWLRVGYRLDELVENDDVLVLERGPTTEHLEDEAAEGPEVHHAVVANLPDELGREVALGAAEAVCVHESDWLETGTFGESEVCEADVASEIEEDVFGLEVSVDHANVLMKILETEEDLGSVEAGGVQGEPLEGREVVAKVAAGKVLKAEEEVSVVLEGREELDDEVVLAGGEDVSFGDHLVQGSMSHRDLALLDHLEST